MVSIAILGVTELDSVLTHTIQQGLLVGEYSKGLKSKEVFRQDVEIEQVPVGAGESFTKFRKGRLTPQRRPRGPIKTTHPNNGFTAEKAGAEQYTWYMERYGHTTVTETSNSVFTFRNNLKQDFYDIGENAAESIDLAVRMQYMLSYKSGVSFVDTADTGATTVFQIDNVAGFDIVMVAGVPTAVSGSNKLAIIANGTADNVVACTPDTTTETINGASVTFNDVQDDDDRIPGTVTLETGYSDPAVGHVFVSTKAPQQVRPNGRASEYQLASGDELTMAHVNRITAGLRGRGVQTFSDGCYHAYCDPVHFEQLWNDSSFSSAFQGTPNEKEFRNGEVVKVGNIKFDFTGQCPARPHPDTTKANAGIQVRNCLIVGKGALVEGRNKAMYSRPDLKPQATATYVKMFDKKKFVEIIMRGPQDLSGRVVNTTWEAILAWVATTDSLTSYGSIQADAYYKRGGLIQTV